MNTTTHLGTRVGLHWAVKQSFLNYISALADGECSATDGCVIESGFGFWFEADSSVSGVDNFAFRGDLRFAGHHGMLFVRLADPRIRLEGNSGTISVVTVDDERIDIATCVFASLGAGELVGTSLELSEQGATLFGNIYRAGQPLDDFSVIRELHQEKTP